MTFQYNNYSFAIIDQFAQWITFIDMDSTDPISESRFRKLCETCRREKISPEQFKELLESEIDSEFNYYPPEKINHRVEQYITSFTTALFKK